MYTAPVELVPTVTKAPCMAKHVPCTTPVEHGPITGKLFKMLLFELLSLGRISVLKQ